MESARNAISGFIGRSGQHDTQVEEVVNPAVTSETIKPTRHEETTQAVDREVHQDHYHTTVQPIQHQEVLPEQHTHNLQAVEEREFHHGNREETQSKVAAELGQFRDNTTTHATQVSQSQAAPVTGEHVHHHVHETVQPIIHKETIQPEYVHTVVPIHETHHAPSEHHGMSTLPERTLTDFQQMGGALTGSSHNREEYEGHPRPYNSAMQVERHPVDINPREHDGTHDLKATGHSEGGSGLTGAGTGVGPHSSGVANTLDPRVDSDLDGSRIIGNNSTTAAGYSTTGSSQPSTGTTTHGYETGTYGYGSDTTGQANPSAMGSGTHGVGAGAVAADLGRDHTRAGQNTDMSRDLESTGNTDSNLTGTSLGGRTEGNTIGGASDHASHGLTGTREHEREPSNLAGTREHEREPSNLTGNQEESHESHHGHKHDSAPVRDDVQSPSQGKDPALVGEKSSGKLTGSGVDGSHSAVFGLTPDGHKHEDTAHGQSGKIQPAHSKETSNSRAASPGPENAAAKSGVAEQLNDPKVAEKGHGGQAEYGSSNSKPGAGLPSSAGEQGSGTVRPGENDSGAASAGKMNPLTDADHDGKAGVMD